MHGQIVDFGVGFILGVQITYVFILGVRAGAQVGVLVDQFILLNGEGREVMGYAVLAIGLRLDVSDVWHVARRVCGGNSRFHSIASQAHCGGSGAC